MAGISNANNAQLANVGDYFRQMEQQRLQAPISLLSSQVGMTNQLPLSLFHGQVSKTKESDPFGRYLDYLNTSANVLKTFGVG